MDANWTKVKTIECLGEVDDYVYDISVQDGDPFFFANDILVHNTDSAYFSAWPAVKDEVQAGTMEWSKEIAIGLYDSLGEQVNDSFPDFMNKAFHTPTKYGSIIKAGRELVADRGLFIVPKRYAVNIIDLEGKRLDKDGKMGKVKAMGLDLKRSDTPKHVQDFLMHILEMVLAGKSRADVLDDIKEFKRQFSKSKAWTMGSPKSVNNLTTYGDLEKNSETGKANMPGHVRAAINWNKMRKMHGDNYSLQITDGMRIVVCKLLPNAMGFTSIAYPTDELRLPQWFCELPFDEDLMIGTVIDQKLENLLGVLNWDFKEDINIKSTFNDLFQFT
jgi:hypothetical protein